MLNRFFILCSGADQNILDQCAPGERHKYVGIGATVFFTAVMAMIAGSYALYTIFDTYVLAFLFGIVWGLLIFNLDRYIVSTLRKRDSFRAELLQAAPRLILALIIAIVISKPLELKIFEKEIDRVLLEEKNALTLQNKDQIADQYRPEIDKLTAESALLKNEVTAKENEVDALYETYIAEAEGRKGTKLLGKGPVYKEKRDKHDAALTALDQLRMEHNAKVKAITERISSLQRQQANQVATSQPIIDNFDGLMARINALDTLPWLPSFFIFLLFLAIESAPVIAKLLSPKGTYDIKLDDQEDAVNTWAAQNSYERKTMLAADQELNDKVYGDLKSEEELYTHKKKIARSLLQEQAEAFYKKQTRIS